MTRPSDSPLHIHATAVALDGRALLFSGPAGSGKSAMALELMALGCRLISDDVVILSPDAGRLMASAPSATFGLVEARGLGILPVQAEAGPVPVLAQVDLSRDEVERLPRLREIDHAGVRIPLLRRPPGSHAAAALLHYLRAGRTHET